MAFVTSEISNFHGRPIALYEFRRGQMVLGYAAADQDIHTSARTFIAAPMENHGVKQKGTAVTDVFEITCPRSLEIVQWFRYTPPSDIVYLTVRRFHYGDAEAVIIWIGQVVAVSENADETATIRCQAVSITLKRGGLRLTWQRGCPHALYDQNCRADKTAFAVPTSIGALGTNYFTVSTGLSGAAFWPGGIIEWQPSPGTYERRLIEHVIGSQVFPYGQMDGYTPGMAVTLYPGCKRTSSWCNDFFSNLSNYGGFPFMPTRSPFNGDPIF